MMLPLRKDCVADACWAPISAPTSPAPTSNDTPQQRGMRRRRKRIEPGSPTALRDGEIFLDSFNDQAARWHVFSYTLWDGVRHYSARGRL
jgi:hypothetical protein